MTFVVVCQHPPEFTNFSQTLSTVARDHRFYPRLGDTFLFRLTDVEQHKHILRTNNSGRVIAETNSPPFRTSLHLYLYATVVREYKSNLIYKLTKVHIHRPPNEYNSRSGEYENLLDTFDLSKYANEESFYFVIRCHGSQGVHYDDYVNSFLSGYRNVGLTFTRCRDDYLLETNLFAFMATFVASEALNSRYPAFLRPINNPIQFKVCANLAYNRLNLISSASLLSVFPVYPFYNNKVVQGKKPMDLPEVLVKSILSFLRSPVRGNLMVTLSSLIGIGSALDYWAEKIGKHFLDNFRSSPYVPIPRIIPHPYLFQMDFGGETFHNIEEINEQMELIFNKIDWLNDRFWRSTMEQARFEPTFFDLKSDYLRASYDKAPKEVTPLLKLLY